MGISASQVWRLCKALDLKPWPTESWMTSHDPDFWEKAADVCGLYLDPPVNAVVWSVDEKSGIQAKSRVNPTKPVVPGIPLRQEFEYTHASWLNQVGLFFSILERRLLRRGEFTSVGHLTERIISFINDYNRRAKPFRWTYDSRPLKIA